MKKDTRSEFNDNFCLDHYISKSSEIVPEAQFSFTYIMSQNVWFVGELLSQK